MLFLICRHHHEDWDANRTSLTLDSYLDRYQRTAACQQKNIMICRSCNSAIYNVSLTASEHNSYHVWCFGSGVFTRLPKVRLSFTRIQTVLRMHRLRFRLFSKHMLVSSFCAKSFEQHMIVAGGWQRPVSWLDLSRYLAQASDEYPANCGVIITLLQLFCEHPQGS